MSSEMRDFVHDAICRALDEAGIKNETLRGMCLEVGLEKFDDGVAALTKKSSPPLWCPECDAQLLYECVACSCSNYPERSALLARTEAGADDDKSAWCDVHKTHDQCPHTDLVVDESVRLRQLFAASQEQVRVLTEMVERGQKHHERMMKLMDPQDASGDAVPDGMVLVQIEDAKRLADRVLMSDPVYVQLSGRRIRACIAAMQAKEAK